MVASFGGQHISLTEFRVAYLDYLKNPNIFDSRERREKFLDELIQRRILAGEAQKAGLADDEKLSYRIKAFRDKKLRDIHYQKLIKPQIEVSEEEIQEAYRFTQEKRRIRHLFTQTIEEAEELHSRLERGESFDKLAEQVFRSDTALANSGGDLGWVEWDQLEYDLAMAAFRQPLNSYSKPLKSQFGYHIIQVTDFQKKPLITRQEYEIRRKNTRYLLENKIGKKIAGNYIQKKLAETHVQVYPDVLRFVGEKLAQLIKRRPSQYDQLFEKQLSEAELQRIELGLWDVREDILAVIDGNPFTVADFITSLIYLPYDLVFSGYKKALDYAIRDFVLTKDAQAEGFDQVPELEREVNLYREYLLQLKLRRKLVTGVTVRDAEIKDQYEREKEAKYKNADFVLVKDIIKKELEREKRKKAVPDFLSGITKGMKIEKNVEVIHGFYDELLQANPSGEASAK